MDFMISELNSLLKIIWLSGFVLILPIRILFRLAHNDSVNNVESILNFSFHYNYY